MNPIRLFGVLAMAAGGGVLVSESIFGQDLFAELTGSSFSSLWPMCAVTILLGALAIALGMREEHEFRRHKGGADT